jgi:NAD(P)-dependent dehydrogenase (short-subunit alcohol dehydrogenase family)
MESVSEIVSLEGRRVLVTGASSGIGKAMAHRFADAGASLVLVDVDEAGLSCTVDELPEGGRASHWCVDLGREEQVHAFWDELASGGPAGLPDAVVNNAGIYTERKLEELDQEMLDRMLRVNLESVFWMCQRFIMARGAAGGVIVNVSTIEATIPFKDHMAHYGASKAGVEAMTRGIAHEYGRKGFRANTLVPGGIRTEGTERWAKEALKRLELGIVKEGHDFMKRVPMGRMGAPDEVARAALFLVSDMSSYVTGATLAVDGGFLIG